MSRTHSSRAHSSRTHSSRGAPSFYWYDLETSGIEPRWDRIVQFAGIRTDMDLNPTGDEYCTYVQLPADVLPDPTATLVTGITPQLTREKGISEWQALTRVHNLFSQPNSCVAGYNSLRFDDEFIRFGFYRNLRDPYAREWQNNNSRWDLIDLVRATGALRRDGMQWPTNEEGLPAYNLGLMAQANGLEHDQAHDALSDVHVTVALAKLIKTAQPRLFAYYLGQRYKKQARQLLEPYGARVCLHVSGMYPRERYGSAPVVSICRHPTNSNSIVVADLSQDIESLLTWQPEEIRENLFKRGVGVDRPPLKEIRINRCPFVAGIEVLTSENWSRIGFQRKAIEERARKLKKPGIAQKIMRVYAGRAPIRSEDPDAALYDSLPRDADKHRCASFQTQLEAGKWLDLDFEDKRLHVLAARLKARSFPEMLTAEQKNDWREFVSGKLQAQDAPWKSLPGYGVELAQAGQSAPPSLDPARREELLHALAEHAAMLTGQYAG
jgi:exodeoxyribonuclease-1